MHLDPNLGELLLEPLLRFQASPSYTIPYAAADLGAGVQDESQLCTNAD